MPSELLAFVAAERNFSARLVGLVSRAAHCPMMYSTDGPAVHPPSTASSAPVV